MVQWWWTLINPTLTCKVYEEAPPGRPPIGPVGLFPARIMDYTHDEGEALKGADARGPASAEHRRSS